MRGQEFRGKEAPVAVLPGEEALGMALPFRHLLGRVRGRIAKWRRRRSFPGEPAQEDLAADTEGDEKQSGGERHADWDFDDTACPLRSGSPRPRDLGPLRRAR